MPDFLKDKKQLSSKKATRARCVAKIRWIVESGRLIRDFSKPLCTSHFYTFDSQRENQAMAIFLVDNLEYEHSLRWWLFEHYLLTHQWLSKDRKY
jgi:hypothetical protein